MKKLDIFHLIYNEIIKYLDYVDYLNFNKILNNDEISKYHRKCLFCNKIPFLPVTINLCTNLGFINKYKSHTIKKCIKSLMNPICLSCAINEWINKFNKDNFKIRKKKGFICPFGCCQFKSNHISCLLDLRYIGSSHLIKNDNLKNTYKFWNKNNTISINYNTKLNHEYFWKNIYENENVNCRYCLKKFDNDHHLFTHFKYNCCKRRSIKMNRFVGDLDNLSDSDSDTSLDSYFDNHLILDYDEY